MRPTRSIAFALCLVGSASACARGGSDHGRDGGSPRTDAGKLDAGPIDAALSDGANSDATTTRDSAAGDDAFALDTSALDTGRPIDAYVGDAWRPPDTGPVGCSTDTMCDDSLPCTTDHCASGMCMHVAIDADGDGDPSTSCGGTDCNDSNPAVNGHRAEVCNAIDDDCSGAPDDGPGMTCLSGSSPMRCTTSCGTTGSAPCAACVLGTCRAAAETCGNGCDDDGNGIVDEGCSSGAPVNDTCAAPTPLSGRTGTMSDTLAGATAQTSDCGGAEVFYSIALGARSIVYVDTFGTAFNTAVSYRGMSCPGGAVACNDDACGVSQSMLVGVLDAGTHYVAVHASGGAAGAAFSLRWNVVPAAGGLNMAATNGTFYGTTGGANALTASCGGNGPEDAYYFTLCPGVSRSVTASLCDGSTTYDTNLFAQDGNGEVACNDDDPTGACFWSSLDSEITFSANGPGLFVVYPDGYAGSSGSYGLTLSGI